jgi:hypothetical protein
MSGEINHRHDATGGTLYAVLRTPAGLYWAAPDWEALATAHWANYAIPLTETPSGGYHYFASFPAVVAGWYWVDLYDQAGGSPAIADTPIASYLGYWDGTTFIWWANDVREVAGEVVEGDEPGPTAAELWTYTPRTLTTPAAGEATPVDTDSLTIRRGDTWTQTITGLGSLVGRTALVLTAKVAQGAEDAAAKIQVSEGHGLTVLLGDDPDADQTGSLTVDDEAAGDITIVLSAAATAALAVTPSADPMLYDIQLITAAGVRTLVLGTLAVTYDVTRAVE